MPEALPCRGPNLSALICPPLSLTAFPCCLLLHPGLRPSGPLFTARLTSAWFFQVQLKSLHPGSLPRAVPRHMPPPALAT